MMINRTFNIFLICLSLMIFVSACERDRCEPPFEAGVFSTAGVGLKREGPINEGDKFSLSPGVYTSSAGNIEDVKVVITLPAELKVETIIKPDHAPAPLVKANSIEWQANVKPSTQDEFTISLISKNDWKKWSHPIEVDVSLYYTSKGKCPNYPDGFYKKKITWSHEGFNNPDWQERPKP